MFRMVIFLDNDVHVVRYFIHSAAGIGMGAGSGGTVAF